MQQQRFTGFTVGVTGGIGSGKSAVCEILSTLGRTVIAADPLARVLMETDEGIRNRLKRLLGDRTYSPGGSLDRGFVASRIFTSPALREKVNRIVHPKVFEAISRQLSTLPPERRDPYVVIEAALIYESGMDKLLDVVVVVDADLQTRVDRVMRRDGTTRQEVLNRVQAQMGADRKVRKADVVIGNTQDRPALVGKVRFLDTLLSARSHQAVLRNPPDSR